MRLAKRPKTKYISLRAVDRHFGRSGSYFRTMKSLNREKFDLMFSFSKDMIESVNMYKEIVEGNFNRLKKIFLEDDNSEFKLEIGLLLKEGGLSKSKTEYITGFQFHKLIVENKSDFITHPLALNRKIKYLLENL